MAYVDTGDILRNACSTDNFWLPQKRSKLGNIMSKWEKLDSCYTILGHTHVCTLHVKVKNHLKKVPEGINKCTAT